MNLTEEQKRLIIKANERVRELSQIQDSVFEQLQVDLGFPELDASDEAIEWLSDTVFNSPENYIQVGLDRIDQALNN